MASSSDRSHDQPQARACNSAPPNVSPPPSGPVGIVDGQCRDAVHPVVGDGDRTRLGVEHGRAAGRLMDRSQVVDRVAPLAAGCVAEGADLPLVGAAQEFVNVGEGSHPVEQFGERPGVATADVAGIEQERRVTGPARSAFPRRRRSSPRPHRRARLSPWRRSTSPGTTPS